MKEKNGSRGTCPETTETGKTRWTDPGKVLVVEPMLDTKGQMREWREGGASLRGMLGTEFL